MSWDSRRNDEQGRDGRRGRVRKVPEKMGAYLGDFVGGTKEHVSVRAPYRGICRYLRVSVWQSETMFALPAKGQARITYLYLLTGPHTLAYHVPGLYNIGQQSLREGLGLSSQEFSRALSDLRQSIGMKTDFLRSMVWLPSALDHLGPPANPNIVRGYCRALHLMPKSELRSDALLAYRPFLANLGQSFFEPFADSFPEVCQTIGEPCAIEKREQIKDIQSPSLNSRETHLRCEVAPVEPVTLSKEPHSQPSTISEAVDFDENIRHARDILRTLR